MGGAIPPMGANGLYDQLANGPYSGIRDINQVSKVLNGFKVPGEEYEKLENARLLDPSEYVFNDKLGYISLNSALNADEVLAVAYEYTVRGVVYTVGELTSNAPAAPASLIVKMLRSTDAKPEYADVGPDDEERVRHRGLQSERGGFYAGYPLPERQGGHEGELRAGGGYQQSGAVVGDEPG